MTGTCTSYALSDARKQEAMAIQGPDGSDRIFPRFAALCKLGTLVVIDYAVPHLPDVTVRTMLAFFETRKQWLVPAHRAPQGLLLLLVKQTSRVVLDSPVSGAGPEATDETVQYGIIAFGCDAMCWDCRLRL